MSSMTSIVKIIVMRNVLYSNRIYTETQFAMNTYVPPFFSKVPILIRSMIRLVIKYILCIFGTAIGKLGTGMHIAWRSESTKKQTQNQRNRNDSASSRWYGLGKKKWKYAHKHRGTIHYVGFFSSIRLAGDVAVIKAFALHSNVCVCVCEFTYVGMIAYIASVVVWSMVLHRPLGLVWMIFVIKLCERVSKCVRTYCAHAQTHSRTHINHPYTLKTNAQYIRKLLVRLNHLNMNNSTQNSIAQTRTIDYSEHIIACWQ